VQKSTVSLRAPELRPFPTSTTNGKLIATTPRSQHGPLGKSQRYFESTSSTGELIGEDAARFSLAEQSLQAWGQFLVAVSGVLALIFYAWVYDGGLHWGDQYKDIMEGLAGGDSTLTITYMLGFFAVMHSGLASLRPKAEEIIGARPWRYVFAIVSLPLALSSIVYFINHRYDGIQLWDLRLAPGMHDFVWWTSLVSFLFLYPSTFNLLEVSAKQVQINKANTHRNRK
jgi:zeta-carotene isomerase